MKHIIKMFKQLIVIT